MPITDAQYLAWLANPDAERVSLYELTYLGYGRGYIKLFAADYISIPHAASLDIIAPLTLEARFWAPNPTRFTYVSLFKKDKHYVLRWRWSGGGVLEGLYWDAANVLHVYSAKLATVAGWCHAALALPADPTYGMLYFNGEALPTTHSAASDARDLTKPLTLGGVGNGVEVLDGSLDEVRLWATARSVNQLRAGRWREMAGNETGLVGCWRLNEGAGAAALDATANANHGALVGAPEWKPSPNGLPMEYVLRFSDRGYVSRATDTPANQVYPGIVRSSPRYAVTMDAPFYGLARASWGEIEIENSDGSRDAWAKLNVDGRPIRRYVGAPTWPLADFRLRLSGLLAGVTAEGNRLIFSLRDPSDLLNAPLSTRTIEAGPSAGQLAPLAFGNVFNAEPVLLDETTRTYQFHAGRMNAVSQIRTSGDALVAGTDYSTNLGAGTISLTDPAVGRVTGDILGDASDGVYRTGVADLVALLIRNYGTDVEIDAASFAAFSSAAIMGLSLRDRVNLREQLDALVSSVGAYLAPDRLGRLRIGSVRSTVAPVLTLTHDQIEPSSLRLVGIVPAVHNPAIGYRRNWTVQTDGLAGSVAAEWRAWLGAAQQTVSQAPQPDLLTGMPGAATHLLAEPYRVIDTLIQDQASALAESAARGKKTPGALFSVQVGALGLSLNFGDRIALQHPRYHFDSGRTVIVVGLTESERSRVDLVVYLTEFSLNNAVGQL